MRNLKLAIRIDSLADFLERDNLLLTRQMKDIQDLAIAGLDFWGDVVVSGVEDFNEVVKVVNVDFRQDWGFDRRVGKGRKKVVVITQNRSMDDWGLFIVRVGGFQS